MTSAGSQAVSFEDFKASLSRVQVRTPLAETPEHQKIRDAAQRIVQLQVVDRTSLAEALTSGRGVSSDVRRVLGLAVGLSHERLKSELTAHLTADERRDAARVVEFLDEEFGLIGEIGAARAHSYDWLDILVARAGTRQSAGQAIAGGRSVEDAIEDVVKDLDLPYELRTRFEGRNNRTAPCDIAIPASGAAAQIVCAAKGFDSTGSKLSDAVREIEEMADVRLPRQFVYAVIDGIGWHRRQSDLREIHRLFERRAIDGLYSMAMLGRFRSDLSEAATLRGIARAT